MAQLQSTSISGSATLTGSLIVSGSQPVQLPILNSGSGDIDVNTANQFWYDSGDSYVKYLTIGSYGTGTWTAGGAMINSLGARMGGGAGLQNAALDFVSGCTEEYDGSAWSAGGNMIVSRTGIGGAGTQDAAVGAGGYASGVKTCVEEYNGSSWSTGTAMTNSLTYREGAGSQNAAVLISGYDPPANQTCTEEYNGSSWSAGGAINFSRSEFGALGTQNAALALGGGNGPLGIHACNESYNGTAWSVETALPYARCGIKGPKSGTVNAAYAAGGANPTTYKTCNDEWDGTSWSTAADTLIATGNGSAAGTQSAGLIAGGGGPSTRNCTQEYTKPFVAPFSCYFPGAWSAGGALITARFTLAGTGTQNAGLAISGRTGPGATQVGCTEEYNGTSWASGGTMGTGTGCGGAFGTQNDTLAFGGNCGGAFWGTTCLYDGSTWSSVPTGMSVAGGARGHAGDTSDGAVFGGEGRQECTEEWNGSSWSTGGATITEGNFTAGTGVSEAWIKAGSNGPAVADRCGTELYNGTAWSSGANLPATTAFHAMSGVQNDAITFGELSCRTDTKRYDGTAWSVEAGNLSNSRYNAAGNGSNTDSNSAFIAGGSTGAESSVSCTEEYTRELICTGTYQCYIKGWSSGPNLSKSGETSAGAGASNQSALSFGGKAPYRTSCTEEYDGTSWSFGGAFGTDRCFAAGMGTQNAALAAGGYTNSRLTCVEEYNGTSWSGGGNLPACVACNRGAGTQNAGITMGGNVSPSTPYTSCTREYDGSTWTAGGNLITCGHFGVATGTQNATLYTSGNNRTLCTEEYNGTSWSTGGVRNQGTICGAGFGTQDLSMAFQSGASEEYDGSTWSAGCTLITSRGFLSGAGGFTSGLAFGGNGSTTPQRATEEWSADYVYYNRAICTRCLSSTCTQL